MKRRLVLLSDDEDKDPHYNASTEYSTLKNRECWKFNLPPFMLLYVLFYFYCSLLDYSDDRKKSSGWWDPRRNKTRVREEKKKENEPKKNRELQLC